MFFFNSKVKVADSGLFDGFTDMHCHILPAVDDGVKTLEESQTILQRMEELGVKAVWFTSHIMEEVPNTHEHLQDQFNTFQTNYHGKIDLHLAAEHMLDGLFRERFPKQEILPHANDMLLIETSYSNPPLGMHEMLEQVKSAGFHPLLAHPERYRYMEWDDYKTLKEREIKFQLNIPSLVGAYGMEAKWKAQKLLAEGMYEYAGTDLHSNVQMSCFLESKISRKYAKKIVENLQNYS